jgi:hypothetical protein
MVKGVNSVPREPVDSDGQCLHNKKRNNSETRPSGHHTGIP